MTPLSKEQLHDLQVIVRLHLDHLRNKRDSMAAMGEMSEILLMAINRECDRLNLLDSALMNASDI